MESESSKDKDTNTAQREDAESKSLVTGTAVPVVEAVPETMEQMEQRNTRRRGGTICLTMGTVFVLAALGLFSWNQWENYCASQSAAAILLPVQTAASSECETGISGGETSGVEASGETSIDSKMSEIEIDGNAYIGYLSIPSLELELPVMSTWSYEQLRVSPNRYFGSTKTNDLVIAAHNYASHFGTLKNLSVGDQIFFTDMDGVTITYEVEQVDTLIPTAIEEMTTSGADLTLFTCTYGGQARVTVRCTQVSQTSECTK